MFRNIFIKTRKLPTPLGRWDHRISDKDKEIKSLLSNIDHCGDKICGKPILLKKIIKKNKKLQKNNK